MKQATFTGLFAFLFLVVNAQKAVDGVWEGMLNTGSFSLRLVFHVQKEGDGYKATMDSPDQGATGINVTKAELKGDSLLLEVGAIGGKAVGKLVNDSTFIGQWSQGIARLPLQLKKVAAPSVARRPQTPQPPFPYRSEEVIYSNPGRSIQYGATITLPEGSGPFPAMILVTGSGQQNRDEELFSHKPFAVLSDYLTRQGYVVLRVDDRGIGKTTGDAATVTSESFADDVNVGLNYLKNRAEVAKDKIGILGHSEGGMIAQLVAAERSDVAFVVSLAGPGQKITELMVDQNRAIMQASGVREAATQDYLKLYGSLLPAVVYAASDTAAKLAARALLQSWLKTTPKETVLETTGIKGENEMASFVNAFTESIRSPWFAYFLKYDPAPMIRKMKAKTLVLNGEKDIQVIAKPNLDGWRASLTQSGVKTYDVIELKGLNHLFQRCKTCVIQEYGQLEETIAPEALEVIGNWLKKNLNE